MVAKLCLKARPTPRQLADRLRPLPEAGDEWPRGLELYLDAVDIADQQTMDTAVACIEAVPVPAGFAWLIEGPVGSLDGEFFDVTRDSDADRLVVDRLAEMARRIKAHAVNIHLISPSADPARLTLQCRDQLLQRSLPRLRHFVEVTRAAGAVPTVENMPPVLRMRQGGYFFTPIGMASADLRWAAENVPGLEILPDTSHAGLYLNARSADRVEEPVLEPLVAYARELPDEAATLLGYFQSLMPHVANAQVSGAAGLLGEGLPYGEGDFDLDPVIAWLGGVAEHIVTETLEEDQDDARHMRDCYARMRQVLGPAGGRP